MFTPRDFQLRISRRRTNQKNFPLSRFRNRETPRFCKTRYDRHSYQKLALTGWNRGRTCFEQSLNDP